MCVCVCVCACACVCVCLSVLVCMVGVIVVYVDTVYWFYILFLCLIGCFSMIIWTPTVLSVLYACVLYFCICTCSAQLSMFHMERCPRNMLIIITVVVATAAINFMQCYHYTDSTYYSIRCSATTNLQLLTLV